MGVEFGLLLLLLLLLLELVVEVLGSLLLGSQLLELLGWGEVFGDRGPRGEELSAGRGLLGEGRG